jgi:hypothetical protein
MEIPPGGDVSRFGITAGSRSELDSAGSLAMKAVVTIIGAGTSMPGTVMAGE